MMKGGIYGLGLIVFNIFLLVASAPAYNNNDVTQQNEYHINLDGTFEYNVLENDSTKLVRGILKYLDGKDVLVLEGSYSYTTPDFYNVFVEFATNNDGSTITKTRLNKISARIPPSIPTTKAPKPPISPTPRPPSPTIHPKVIGSILGG